MRSEPVYATLDNPRRFGYVFRRKEPLTESTTPNSLQVPPDPNSSNNPPLLGQSATTRNVQTLPTRPAPKIDRVPTPINREADKGKGVTPPEDRTKGFSYNVLEALGNAKLNLIYLETLEIDEVRPHLMGHLLEVEECRTKSKSSMPPFVETTP